VLRALGYFKDPPEIQNRPRTAKRDLQTLKPPGIAKVSTSDDGKPSPLPQFTATFDQANPSRCNPASHLIGRIEFTGIYRVQNSGVIFRFP